MQERVFSWSFLCACAVWVPLAIWILTLIGWIIQDEIEAFVGMLGVALAVGMGVASWIATDRWTSPVILVASFASLLLVPMARNAREKRAHVKIDLEQIERAYDQLKASSDNVGAKMRIARTLYKRGAPERAVAVAEKCLDGLSKPIFEEEFQTVATWKRGLSAQRPSSIRCIDCGTENEASEVQCTKCRAPILLYYAKGHWIDPVLLRKLICAWSAVVLTLIGIPLAGRFLGDHSDLAVIALLVVSAALVFLAFRKRASEDSA